MRRIALAVVPVVALVAALAACGGDGDDETTTTSTSSSTSSTTTSSSTTTTSTTAFEGSTSPTSVPADDIEGVALLTAVRVGEDRVVFEMRGDTAPAVDARYVDEARAAGSGNRVEVEGGALLEIRMAPSSGVDLEGDAPEETYTGPDRVEGDGPITEVVRTGDFEANLTWVIGFDTERPYRVLRLADPGRVVVLFG